MVWNDYVTEKLFISSLEGRLHWTLNERFSSECEDGNLAVLVALLW